ncbi:MAG: MinD/ParA family protein, partial [Deltaproteobacteria bacterium]
MPRIITITSGKGGVGKTNISLNVALYLASEGHRTCLFDADLGLANINILLGLQPEYTLKDLILDGRTIDDIIIRDYKGIDILPGSSGVEQVANLDPSRTQELIGALSQLEDYDFLLFDTSAGISKNVISFCLATLELVVIITPEPTSLTDAYSLVKVLSMNGYQGKLQVVVNQCKDFSAAKSVYNKFRGAIQKYLGMQVYALGVVFEDPKVVEAVKQQEPLLIRYPGSLASQCIRKIGQKLLDGTDEELSSVQVEGFWKRWLGVIQGPLKLKETGQKPSKESEENNEQG